MEKSTYEKILYETLNDLAPVPPDLWSSILATVEIRTCKKKQKLEANLLDLHIVLDGIIVKRWDHFGIISKDVLDFICKKEFIFHTGNNDGSYFECDGDAVTVFISNENMVALLTQFPIFTKHISYFFAEVLKHRAFRGNLFHKSGLEKKKCFKKEYPEPYRMCTVKDKSSFLGMTPNYYSKLDV